MTIKFNNAYIKNYYTLLGRNEHFVNLKVDERLNDYYDGEKSVEGGEKEYQKRTLKGLLKKENLKEENIDLSINSDLQNQLFASSFGNKNTEIPHLGIYSACSSFTEGLIIGSSFLDKENINKVIITVSSHNLASEKQFRYPIEYGAIRKKVSTFTATGSVSSLITKEKTNIKIENATIGKITDIGYNDANNFGACMTPGAAKTLYEHFKDTERTPNYYDLILTGDLGIYGIKILKEYMKSFYNIEINNILDAGSVLYDKKSNEHIAGGSGPTCLPLILFSKILKNKKYKRILLVGTGSLHSRLSTNLNETIPSISHIVSLEVGEI